MFLLLISENDVQDELEVSCNLVFVVLIKLTCYILIDQQHDYILQMYCTHCIQSYGVR